MAQGKPQFPEFGESIAIVLPILRLTLSDLQQFENILVYGIFAGKFTQSITISRDGRSKTYKNIRELKHDPSKPKFVREITWYSSAQSTFYNCVSFSISDIDSTLKITGEPKWVKKGMTAISVFLDDNKTNILYRFIYSEIGTLVGAILLAYGFVASLTIFSYLLTTPILFNFLSTNARNIVLAVLSFALGLVLIVTPSRTSPVLFELTRHSKQIWKSDLLIQVIGGLLAAIIVDLILFLI